MTSLERRSLLTVLCKKLVLAKKTHYPLIVIEAQIQAKKQIHNSKQQQTQDTAANLLPQLSETSQMSMVYTQEKGISTTLPISEHSFALHKGTFRNALALDMDGTLLTHLHIASVGNHSL